MCVPGHQQPRLRPARRRAVDRGDSDHRLAHRAPRPRGAEPDPDGRRLGVRAKQRHCARDGAQPIPAVQSRRYAVHRGSKPADRRHVTRRLDAEHARPWGGQEPRARRRAPRPADECRAGSRYQHDSIRDDRERRSHQRRRSGHLRSGRAGRSGQLQASNRFRRREDQLSDRRHGCRRRRREQSGRAARRQFRRRARQCRSQHRVGRERSRVARGQGFLRGRLDGSGHRGELSARELSAVDAGRHQPTFGGGGGGRASRSDRSPVDRFLRQ